LDDKAAVVDLFLHVLRVPLIVFVLLLIHTLLHGLLVPMRSLS
jgi:hypothetical protein